MILASDKPIVFSRISLSVIGLLGCFSFNQGYGSSSALSLRYLDCFGVPYVSSRDVFLCHFLYTYVAFCLDICTHGRSNLLILLHWEKCKHQCTVCLKSTTPMFWILSKCNFPWPVFLTFIWILSFTNATFKVWGRQSSFFGFIFTIFGPCKRGFN